MLRQSGIPASDQAYPYVLRTFYLFTHVLAYAHSYIHPEWLVHGRKRHLHIVTSIPATTMLADASGQSCPPSDPLLQPISSHATILPNPVIPIPIPGPPSSGAYRRYSSLQCLF